jgi:hypothetical protein
MLEIKLKEKYTMIIFLLLLLFFIYKIIFILPQIGNKYEEHFRRENTKQTITEGIVTNKYIDTTFGARNAELIFVDQREHELFNSEIYQKIEIGDKVRKDKGSIYFYINNVPYIYVTR